MTTSREFVLWKVYLDELWHRHTRWDYYLAQIALEVRRLFAGKAASKYKISDFLITFTRPQQVDPEVAQRQRLESSKSFWLGLVGLAGKKEK